MGLADDGVRVGVVDGVKVGMSVGVSVGAADGAKVGMSVGVSVGAADGVKVGMSVGISVGTAVGGGWTVGALVGKKVAEFTSPNERNFACIFA